MRKLSLSNQRLNEVREVVQFFYHAWPDQGVPEKPLSVLQYLTAINKQRERNVLANRGAGPVVVHCSAGIGRTGLCESSLSVVLCRLLIMKHYLDEKKAR